MALRAPSPLPPGPRGSFLTGNLQAYEEDRLGFMLRARRDYGPIVSFDSRTTMIFEPAAVDRVLRDPSTSFEVSQNFLGQALSDSQIEAIMEVRQFLNPGLRKTATGTVPHHISRLVCDVLGQREVTAIDPMAFTERVIPRAFAWRLFGENADPFGTQVVELLDLLEKVVGNVFAAPAAWRSPTQRRIESRHADLRLAVSRHMANSVTPDPERRLPTPAAEHIARLGGAHSPALIADLVIGAMLAAQRVPAAGAAWIMMMLADRPEWQAALRPEAEDFSDRISSGASVVAAHSPLTLAVVLETLRCYPPTWLITRVATRPTTLAGYDFQPGHMFMISPYVLHRDSAVYDRPNDFDPHRWLGTSPPAATFLPFGRGRHRCPGGDIATTSLVALTLSLIGRYNISRSGTVVADPRNTLKPSGLTVHLEPSESIRQNSGSSLERTACQLTST